MAAIQDPGSDVGNGNYNNAEFDGTDHQAAYIFTPSTSLEDASQRPSKRRRVGNAKASIPEDQIEIRSFKFAPLLNGDENPKFVKLRQELFENLWSSIERGIGSILNEANGRTLEEVTEFVQNERGTDRVPAGFIVTGPNIASQDLLFSQLSERLSTKINGPVATLRSGEASNLKMLLKKLIRDVTNQRSTEDGEEEHFSEQDGRKLLNYDLEIVHGYVKAHGCQKVIVAVQDSEAFDPGLLADFIVLFNSWLDRIPFVLLFGIATSVELFHERLSRNATRSLFGAQFDVEQTTTILEKVFQAAVAGSTVSLRLGTGLISSLMERQHDHVQSVQVFISALKYAYMCHFLSDPLSALLGISDGSIELEPEELQPEHLEAVRILPSFKKHIVKLVDHRQHLLARELITDDEALRTEIAKYLSQGKDIAVNRVLSTVQILSDFEVENQGKIDLYIKASMCTLKDSEIVHRVLDVVKRATPKSLLAMTRQIISASENGSAELDLEPWDDECPEFLEEVVDINNAAASFVSDDPENEQPVRSVYTMHNKTVRTTVVAQKVQLSQETSRLSQRDKDFTALIDRLLIALKKYVVFDDKLQDVFLSEVWIYDSKSPYLETFTPKPRFAIERALSSPHDYLGCECCDSSKEGASMSHPPTAILYKLFLEAGSLINIYDLWTAFLANLGSEHIVDSEDSERHVLMLFYRALADLKSLGMVKQSRKKTDHLTKLTWKGL